MKFKQQKTTQSYLDKLMRFYPDIKFGRKKYKEQYIRVQKNILTSMNPYRFNRPQTLEQLHYRDIFTKHFHITTSGNFSDSALLCTIMEMGADRIIFSVDWPYVENKPGTDWLETISVSPEDKQKILNGNAKKLLRM